MGGERLHDEHRVKSLGEAQLLLVGSDRRVGEGRI
jgi:hypothetical protein